MSNEKITFHQKMSNFFVSIGTIKKDKENPYYNSLYADINSILKDIKKPLSSNGLRLSEKKYFDKEIDQWVINLRVIDIDNPSDFEETFSPIIAKDPRDPQKHIAATTYARRDALVTLLNLAQEDDDGNAAAEPPKEQYPTPNIKQKKLELSSYLKTHNIIGDKQKAFVQYLKSKNYNIEDFKQLNQLLQNKNLLDKLIDEYISIEAEKAM